MADAAERRARLSIDVSAATRRRVRLAAARRDQSIRDYVVEALTERLREDVGDEQLDEAGALTDTADRVSAACGATRPTPSMTTYSRGDIVLVKFVFADEKGVKQRPGLLVSSARYHRSRREESSPQSPVRWAARSWEIPAHRVERGGLYLSRQR